MGLLALEASLGWRTQVPSPWFSPSMKRVVKRVWAFAAVARPRTVARSFMLDISKENRFDKHKRGGAENQFCYKTARVEVVD